MSGTGRPRARGVPWRPLALAGGVLVLWLVWLVVSSVVTGRGESVTADPAAPLPVASGVVGVPSEAAPSQAAPVDPGQGDAIQGDAPPSEPGPFDSAAPSGDPADATAPAGAGEPAAAAGPADATGPIPDSGPGTFRVAEGGTGSVGDGATVVRYSVEVEDGLPLDPAAVAARVDQILDDERSWIGLGRWTLQRVGSRADADARIVVSSPGTVDNLCYPLQTMGKYSCRNGPYVVLNAVRWTQGAQSWGADVDGYRGYQVNHEFGHYLGFSHTPCPAAGQPAPVMLQQTKGLDGCLANAWPTVTGG